MATSMEKKIAELEMGLLHLQQNIDIPGTQNTGEMWKNEEKKLGKWEKDEKSERKKKKEKKIRCKLEIT